MPGKPTREAKVEFELGYLIKKVLERKSFVIEGVKFRDVEPQFHVDSGIADLMLPVHPSKPLLIVECKRKAETAKGIAIFRNFDPMSSRVITQALSYAVQSGAPLFATTNGKVFALFTTPERGEAFRIDRHRLLVREIQLKEEMIGEILTLVARWKAGLTITKTPVDWAFILRLRSFVEYLSQQLLPVVEEKLKTDKVFKDDFDKFTREVGRATPETYSRESAHIIMNKIVFYKVLERYYGKLPKMKPMKELDGATYAARLSERFSVAMSITKDFEPVFSTSIYDQAPLPDNEVVLDEVNSFIEEMDAYRLEEIGSDVVGFIYERLIPDEERHRLGQFYTPPQIAELITKWAIRAPTDKVIDPACGSGTFLVKAYGVLKDMKPLRDTFVHKEVLSQIYCVDINPFPAHLTAMNLAMRDVRHPTSEMNVIVEDFFNVKASQKLLAPYAIKMARGEFRREIAIPRFQAVVANPPYTKWTEISQRTKNAILTVLKGSLKDYRLTGAGGVRSAQNPGIYIHFVMWAESFLEEHGRLGMIISKDWLNTDYGVKFSNFLIDTFKIKGVIDFASRLFTIPLIGTTVILLEKEKDKAKRANNKSVFVYVDKEASVEKLLNVLSNPKKYEEKFTITELRQAELPKDEKWVKVLFNATKIYNALAKSGLIIRLEEMFKPVKGNFDWSIRRAAGLGANTFFYLNYEDVKQRGLKKYVLPALVSPRYSRFFTFTRRDWEKMSEEGKVCYAFVCHLPRDKLKDTPVEDYINWGETQCETRDGVVCSQSAACQQRERDSKHYFGWYDIGEVRETPIFAPYYARYKRRFTLADPPIALDPDLIGLVPNEDVKLENPHLKALLAYLNSSFVELFIETRGRVPGGVGAIAFEANQAVDLPIIDVGCLNKAAIKKLSKLFDELEETARAIQRADTRGALRKLAPVITNIDMAVATILRIPTKLVKVTQDMVETLRERRLIAAEVARPEAVTGEEAPRIRPPRRASRTAEVEPSAPLDRWT